MKRPGLFEGVLIAAGFALVAGIVGTVLTPLFGIAGVVRLLIPALAFAYVLYLLRRSGERTGRLTVVAAWLVMALANAWLAPSFALYFAVHAGALWLLRSLYFYSGIVPALMDLALCTAGIGLTAWAAMHSGSLALATWCFFLVQAFFVLIPASLQPQPTSGGASAAAEDFNRARRQAEAALQQLFTR